MVHVDSLQGTDKYSCNIQVAPGSSKERNNGATSLSHTESFGNAPGNANIWKESRVLDFGCVRGVFQFGVFWNNVLEGRKLTRERHVLDIVGPPGDELIIFCQTKK